MPKCSNARHIGNKDKVRALLLYGRVDADYIVFSEAFSADRVSDLELACIQVRLVETH